MDTTISWMIGNRPNDEPHAERRAAHLRALHEARPPRPAVGDRLAAAVAAFRTGSAPGRPQDRIALDTDTVCCTA